ncbi:MAG: two-component sensor histidine kinase, partial [Planctomycetota bacterium]
MRLLLEDAHLPDSLDVRADTALLQVILNNLLSNAVMYAPAGATISATGRAIDGVACQAISNPAVDLPPEPQRCFERFWRAEQA